MATYTSSAKVTGATNAQILETAHLCADSIRVQGTDLQKIIDNVETDGLTPSKLVQRETIGEGDYYILTDDTGQPVEVKLPVETYPKMQYSTGVKYINWDVSGVTNGQDMFGNCANLEIVDNNFKNLTNGSSMFRGCNELKSANLGEAKPTAVLYMFYECPKLASVNIDLSLLSSGNSMFQNCSSLKEINLSNLNSLQTGNGMFSRMFIFNFF